MMKTDAHVRAARRLLELERANGHPAPAAAEQVYGALFRRLAPVVGAAGFRALFARSVKLGKADFPGLGEVSAEGDGQAPQLAECLRRLEPTEAAAVAIGVYASLFGLLSNFVGERLLGRVLQSAFPGTDETFAKEKASDE